MTLLLHKPGAAPKAQCCQCRKLYALSESEVERLAKPAQAAICPACVCEITERFRGVNQRRKAR